MTTPYDATLNRRRVQIVELMDPAELERARDCARRRNRTDLRPNADDVHRGLVRTTETSLTHNEIGAQGEIVVGMVLGIRAPLDVDTFRAPDLSPNWSIKTQHSTSKDTLDGYLRLMTSALHAGWRHVLVERAIHLHGHLVFTVHGWIPDEQARDVAVQRYAYSTNRFVHVRHLRPLDRELYDTVHGAPTDEPPAPAPFDTDMGAADG